MCDAGFGCAVDETAVFQLRVGKKTFGALRKALALRGYLYTTSNYGFSPHTAGLINK